MELQELADYLDGLLDIQDYDDRSVNGLQLEATSRVSRLAIAVDASLDAIEGAIAAAAQLLLCHHGLLWGETRPIRGVYGTRVRRLFEGQVSLYAAHLPLDAHPRFGNNAVLAQKLCLEDVTRFGTYRGQRIGLAGSPPEPCSAEELLEQLAVHVGPALGSVLAGPDRVGRVALVSGAAGNIVEQAAEEGVEMLVTGETDHTAAVFARDQGLHLVFLGHHATEVFGVRALAEHLQDRFGLPWTEVGGDSGF